MKIAIEAQRIFRKEKHGIDIVALELIRHLQKIDKVNEYFILVKSDKDNQIISETDNFHIIETPSYAYPLWEQIYLPRILKKVKPDILHCTGNTAPLNLNIPLILTLHDIIFMKKKYTGSGRMYHRLGLSYYQWLVPRIIYSAKAIITVSEYGKQCISDYFSLTNDKIGIIYNGYNKKEFHPISDEHKLKACRSKYNLPEQFIFHLGNEDPRKNLVNVIKAASLLYKNKAINIPLVISSITQKKLTRILRKINMPEMESFIHLPGYIPREDLACFYNMASVFLFPSFDEGFGMPVIEAMACGTPVITSNLSSMPEVAGEAALLVNPGNPEEIASVIKRLLLNKNMALAYQNAGLKRAPFFSWNNTANQVLEIYEKTFKRKNHPFYTKSKIWSF